MKIISILRPLVLSSLLASVACVGHSTAFQTEFGPAPVQTTAQIAPASQSLLALDEEGDDNPSTDCRQELGSDAGADLSEAHSISAERIHGCFDRGDTVDSFVLTAPTDTERTVFHIELENRGGSAIGTTINSIEGTSLASDSWILEGDIFTNTITLAAGERALISIANRQASSPEAWYRLEAAFANTLASR